MLGTEVRCRSRVGRGSVFEISLPLAHESDVQAASAQVPVTPAVKAFDGFAGKRVVVIENDSATSEAIRISLEMHDMHVTLFGTAEDALGCKETSGADYFITDYHLTGMDGLQMLNTIQGSSAKRINAVLLTGDTSSRHIEQLMQSSRWAVHFKPARLSDLLSSFRNPRAM